MTPLALVLAFVWGGIWAAFLQFTKLGQFLAIQRTWVTVVVGIGVDLAIALLCVPMDAWLRVAGVIVFSSMCIIARSLANEQRETAELGQRLRGEQDATGK